jgi:hypothetical protein
VPSHDLVVVRLPERPYPADAGRATAQLKNGWLP